MTKGKKIILTILMSIIILGGLGVGLFFAFKDSGSTLTIDGARNLINTVCKDLNWYSEQPPAVNPQSSNVSNGNIRTLSIDYEDLNSDAGYESYRSSLFNENEDWVKTNILLAKIAFENSDIQEGVFYLSTASHHGTDSTMLLYFTINQNSVCISVKDGNSNYRVDYVLTKYPENSWTLDGYTNGLMSSESLTYGTNNVYLHYTIKCVSSKVIQYTEDSVCFNSDIEKVEDIDLTDILRLQIHDCNLSNYKRYRYVYYSHSGIGESGITSTEIVDSAKSTFTSYNLIEKIDFNNKIVINKDYLEQLYTYLGYKEA